jgi:DNA-binding transcriptional ArsR family regulator
VNDLARTAALLADETRASFCLALLDGRAWTAGELARHARVAPSTATEHLHRLTAGGLLVEQRQGRHRYVRLAGVEVAQLIEDLAGFGGPSKADPSGRPKSTVDTALARARTCYDHLAGQLGVAVTEAMTRAGLLERDSLTSPGLAWLTDRVGVDAAELRRTRRPLVRSCVDWTERRPHLAGAAGAELCHQFLDRRWVVRTPTSRAVRVTRAGEAALDELLGVSVRSWAGSDR